MQAELTSVQTTDGLTLHGALYRSSAPPHSKNDLLIFVHGVGSNFYQSSLVRKTIKLFHEQGISILSVNTRGHDFVFAAGRGHSESWQGSANEIVDECRLDLDAWIRKAGRLGFERIGLWGHSLGAIKVIYSQAMEPSPDIQFMIAVSPSCLSCSFFKTGSRAEEFEQCLSWAKDQIASSNPSKIDEVSFPFRLMMSPRTFVDKYGEEERYNVLKFLPDIAMPTHLIFGQLEVQSDNPAFEKLDKRAAEAIGTHSRVALEVIPDADHYYSGVQSELAHAMLAWINGLDANT